MIFAQSLPSVPWPVTGAWMLGLIGVLAVAYLVLGVLNAGKKLFGKTPPISEEFAQFRHEVQAEIKSQNEACATCRNQLLSLIQAERAMTDEKLRAADLDRHRSLGELHEKINTMAADVAFIRGKLTNVQSNFKK